MGSGITLVVLSEDRDGSSLKNIGERISRVPVG